MLYPTMRSLTPICCRTHRLLLARGSGLHEGRRRDLRDPGWSMQRSALLQTEVFDRGDPVVGDRILGS